MSPVSKKSFKDWQSEQLQDPQFVVAVNELEPGYQVARLPKSAVTPRRSRLGRSSGDALRRVLGLA